jgi:CMP-N,N'-diacetyllegionaminic acid synthase
MDDPEQAAGRGGAEPVKRVVAVIPARGGSRGIPGKNLVDFCGKPLVAWSIEQARASRRIAETYVSSDSREILDVAERYGAVPIERPANLAADAATSESAWRHALDVIESTGPSVDLVAGLQPTSPVREPEDLDAAIEEVEANGYDSLLSCTQLADYFIWARRHDGPESVNYDYRLRQPRQHIEPRYLENGSFYLFTPQILRTGDNRLGGRIGLFVMPKYKSFQIDEAADLAFVGAIMRGYGLARA